MLKALRFHVGNGKTPRMHTEVLSLNNLPRFCPEADRMAVKSGGGVGIALP